MNQEHIIAKARALLDCVTFDSDGMMIGNIRQGGNGGLLSRESLCAADELRKVLDALPQALPVGIDVVKVSGYAFPGQVRAALTNHAGELRYVVEATGHQYAGMLHIFAPSQIAIAPTCPFCGTPHAGSLPCRHCGEPDIGDAQ